MKQEKIVTLPSGRQVLITIEGDLSQDCSLIETDIQVLVRDSGHENFRPAIGPAHPKYWKIQTMPASKVKSMQTTYSGVSAKLLRKALREFELALTEQMISYEYD